MGSGHQHDTAVRANPFPVTMGGGLVVGRGGLSIILETTSTTRYFYFDIIQNLFSENENSIVIKPNETIKKYM